MTIQMMNNEKRNEKGWSFDQSFFIIGYGIYILVKKERSLWMKRKQKLG